MSEPFGMIGPHLEPILEHKLGMSGQACHAKVQKTHWCRLAGRAGYIGLGGARCCKLVALLQNAAHLHEQMALPVLLLLVFLACALRKVGYTGLHVPML